MTTIRITVTAPDADVATEVKEKFFKKLYEHSGAKVIFEVPAGDDAAVEEVKKFAEPLDCTVKAEDYDDPLEAAEGVDFW